LSLKGSPVCTRARVTSIGDSQSQHCSRFLTSSSSLVLPFSVPFGGTRRPPARSLVTCRLGLSMLVFGWDCVVATGLTFRFMRHRMPVRPTSDDLGPVESKLGRLLYRCKIALAMPPTQRSCGVGIVPRLLVSHWQIAAPKEVASTESIPASVATFPDAGRSVQNMRRLGFRPPTHVTNSCRIRTFSKSIARSIYLAAHRSSISSQRKGHPISGQRRLILAPSKQISLTHSLTKASTFWCKNVCLELHKSNEHLIWKL
jgi:hypothetical protein